MELNTRGRYAVMAMADLAKYGVTERTTKSVSLNEIAKRQGLSEAYLSQIFVQLRQADFVESVRGRSGGYQLARSAESIMVGDIMAAVDERTQMTRCAIDSDIGCVAEKRCLTHGLWAALGHHIEMFLANISLQDVIDNRPLLKAPAKSSSAQEIASE